MTVAAVELNPAFNDLSDVRYLTIEELRNGFEDGRYGHFRKQYYIRSTITDRSVDEKKAALISYDEKKSTYYVEVKEAMIFETNPNGRNNIVSGNTRTVALLALYATGSYAIGAGKEAKTVELTDENFKPIPYRVYNRLLSVHELIDYQVSTNDSTERHNPLDLALKISEIKPMYEGELIEQHKATFGKDPSTKELKTIAGIATQRLCDDFKKTRAALTQYLNVANKGTDKLKQFVFTEKMSLDTANTVVQKLGGDKAKPEAIDKAVEELWTQAKINTGKGEESTIYKSQVLDYFTDKDNAGKGSDAGTGSGTTGTTGTNSGSGSGSGKSDSGDEAPRVSKEDFVKNIRDTVDIVYSVKPDDIKMNQTDKARTITATMANAVAEVLNLVGDEEALAIYTEFKSVFISVFGNGDKLAEAIGASEDVELGKIHKLVSKIAKPAEKLYKELYTLNPETGENVEASTEVITPDAPKTEADEVEAVIPDEIEADEVTVETEDTTVTGIW